MFDDSVDNEEKNAISPRISLQPVAEYFHIYRYIRLAQKITTEWNGLFQVVIPTSRTGKWN